MEVGMFLPAEAHRCVTHMVGFIRVPSIRQILLHHWQLVLHSCCQKQLFIHILRLKEKTQTINRLLKTTSKGTDHIFDQ